MLIDTFLSIILRVALFGVGAWLVMRTLLSAIRTFVLPRAVYDTIARFLFRHTRNVFNFILLRLPDYRARDATMALYGPISVLILVPAFLLILQVGFTLMFYGVGAESLYAAFAMSGSSLFTLGFVSATNVVEFTLAFLEAACGTMITATLIGYIPTIYSMFSKRELLVSTLEAGAGSPPWAVTLIERSFRVRALTSLSNMWLKWADWFTETEESHTSLGVLIFFRSQQPNRSWVTAAGAILDAAALVRSSIDIPIDPQADLMIRNGYLALKYIAKPFGFQYHPAPHFPQQPISVTRAEYDAAYTYLQAIGVPMKPNIDQCWLDFAGWRVNYDAQLLDLCAVVMAPTAPWSADRCQGRSRLTPIFKDVNQVQDSEVSADANSEDSLPDSALPSRVA